MDDSRFDSLTKALIDSSRSRRGVFHVAAAGVAVAFFGMLGLADAEAKKKKPKKCKFGTVRCGKKCCPNTNPAPECAGIDSCVPPTVACHDTPGCYCQSTFGGGGVCRKPGTLTTTNCQSHAQCPGGLCVLYKTEAFCCDGLPGTFCGRCLQVEQWCT